MQHKAKMKATFPRSLPSSAAESAGAGLQSQPLPTCAGSLFNPPCYRLDVLVQLLRGLLPQECDHSGSPQIMPLGITRVPRLKTSKLASFGFVGATGLLVLFAYLSAHLLWNQHFLCIPFCTNRRLPGTHSILSKCMPNVCNFKTTCNCPCATHVNHDVIQIVLMRA